MMVKAIDQVPGLGMDTPHKDEKSILTPDGFVQYIDDQHPIDTVSFGAVSLMQLHREEDQHAWLDLSYPNGQKGQWSQHADLDLLALLQNKFSVRS